MNEWQNKDVMFCYNVFFVLVSQSINNARETEQNAVPRGNQSKMFVGKEVMIVSNEWGDWH